ncbi:hypothetical protein AQJ46_50745 [Streptomyces canus]|uniref:Uncharacterized protein n=1 Tax=Streptomyces canus TaxID=58343 RepID=A0A117QVT2_9ACTN|nr:MULTISPECIES: hypothetical protein [Streptomyces]KUN52663.1 hypothetical protein AQJ46_50745 [Streptomyces canus]MDI5906424.1 hypothetical protein [Streptomyces sp. 12257]
MLFEAPPYYLIDGVSIMRDHADPLQYYYLPLGPQFVTRNEGGTEVPQFLLIKARSEAGNVGFADFDVHLGLPAGQLDVIQGELQRLAGLDRPPRLAPVPVVDGAVNLMLFGATGDAAPGEASLVRAIHHGAKPALYGDNRAAFSVELDQRGITVLDQAMAGAMSPIGVVYSLDYLALRPAYHIRLSVDWDRSQDILDTAFGHEGLVDSAQIQDVCERLIEDRVIQFEADTFVPEDDESGTLVERRDAAVARVRDMITDAFFEASLDPLRKPPDGWDKAREVIRSFSPQRSTPLGVFSYKKTHYSRVDSKRLDVDFSERTTSKRTMYPQGHLAGLFQASGAGLDPARFVLTVNADDPWFEKRKVRVSVSPADFEHDPIRSVTATLTYGGQARTVQLDKDHSEEEVHWPSELKDGQMVMPVDMEYTVDFVPADAGERPNQVSSGKLPVLTEATNIQPREQFSLETIPVLTLASFPFDRYPLVEVELRYDDPDHRIRQDDLVRITAKDPQGSWQRFLVGEPSAPVMARITYRAADQRDHIEPFAPLTKPQVDVLDPFPRRLKVDIVPFLDFNQVDRAFVDLVYEDTANGIKVEDSIEVVNAERPRPFIAERTDPTLSRTRYRITALMKDSTVREGPWSTTLNSRILVTADQRGHRSVTLRSPADFGAQGLARIEVEARAKDETAHLSVEDRFEFTGPDTTGVFEFDFKDPAADAFELKIHSLFSNGLSTERDWSRFDEDTVTIATTV